MNKANKYFNRGLLIFILMIISMLVSLYFEQSGHTILFFCCIVTSIIMSMGMLLVILQCRREIEKYEEEIFLLREREKTYIEKNQQKQGDDNNSHYTEFRLEESLARIIPAEGTDFAGVDAYNEKILQNIAKELDVVQGLVFVLDNDEQMFNISGEYAYFSEERPRSFSLGETISGQVAKNKKTLNLKELPKGYVTVLSGLGKSAPPHLVIAPIVIDDKSIGVIELASFKPFDDNCETLIDRVCEMMAYKLNELRS